MKISSLLAMALVVCGVLAWTNLSAKDKPVSSVGETKATNHAKKSAAATATPTAAHLSVTSAESKNAEPLASAKSSTANAVPDEQCSLKSVAEDKCQTETTKKKK